MASLQVYVRDLGKGLVMLGGRDSFGAGGYLDTPLEETLPVYMTVRDRERSPDVAMVAVVDKSGSMADCHCTGDSRDNANPSGSRGFEKVDVAREAILRAAEALAPTDQLGVVAFDQNAHWAVRTAPIDFGALQAGIGFPADGQTNIYAGLKAAYDDLVNNPATLRHIILITDGWSTHGAYDDLLADMQAAGITLSTIGTGGGSAQILRRLAEESGGRYYEAADATTIPDIFLRETIRTAGEQIVEETFQPIPSASSEILDGLDAGRLPQLLGYNATTAKGSATVSLLTAREDPLLAQWQYGLGRAVAWTSDARQQWATPVDRDARVRHADRSAGGLDAPAAGCRGHRRAVQPRRGRRAQRRGHLVRRRGGPAQLLSDACCASSRPTSSRPRPLLEQVGPGRYAGTVRADQQGAYLVRVAQTFEDESGTDAASRTLGIVSPAAEEYRRLGIDADALATYRRRRRGPRARARRRGGSDVRLDARHRGQRLPDPDLAAGSSCWRSRSSRSTSACVAWRSAAPTCDEPARGPRDGSGWAARSPRPFPASPSCARRRSAVRASRGARGTPVARDAPDVQPRSRPLPTAARRPARVAPAAASARGRGPSANRGARAARRRRWPSGWRGVAGRR